MSIGKPSAVHQQPSSVVDSRRARAAPTEGVRTPNVLRDTLVGILREARRHPVSAKTLHRSIARCLESYRAARLPTVLEGLVAEGAVIALGSAAEIGYYWVGNLDLLKERLCTITAALHRQFPYEAGISAAEIRKRLPDQRTMNSRRSVDPRVFALALQACKSEGRLVETTRGVRLAEFTAPASVAAELGRLEEEVLGCLSRAPHARNGIDALAGLLDADAKKVRTVVAGLVRSGKLHRIAEDRLLESSVLNSLREALTVELRVRGALRIADITVLLGVTRSLAVPLMEYLDSIGFTRRHGDYRRLAPVDA